MTDFLDWFMDSILAYVLGFVLFASLLIGGIVAGVNKLDKWQCVNTGKQIGRHVEYHLSTGCLVEVNGKMIPLGNWREFGDDQ